MNDLGGTSPSRGLRALVRVGLTERGRGLFAAVDLAEGQLIESCPAILLPFEEVGNGVLAHYVFLWEHGSTPSFAIPTGCGLLFNHAHEGANVRFETCTEGCTVDFFALRAIRAGEELLIDYDYADDHLARIDHPSWYTTKGPSR